MSQDAKGAPLVDGTNNAWIPKDLGSKQGEAKPIRLALLFCVFCTNSFGCILRDSQSPSSGKRVHETLRARKVAGVVVDADGVGGSVLVGPAALARLV